MKLKANTQTVILFGAAGVAVYYLSRRGLAAIDPTSKENIFYQGANKIGAAITGNQGFDLQTRVQDGASVELTDSAIRGQQWYIDRGFAYVDMDGVFKLTPTGEEYAAAGASLTGLNSNQYQPS